MLRLSQRFILTSLTSAFLLAACATPPGDGPPITDPPGENTFTVEDLKVHRDGGAGVEGLCFEGLQHISYSFGLSAAAEDLPAWTESLATAGGHVLAGPAPRLPEDHPLAADRIFVEADYGDVDFRKFFTFPDEHTAEAVQLGELVLRLEFGGPDEPVLEETIPVWYCPPPEPAIDFVFESSWVINDEPVICEDQVTLFSYSFTTEVPESIHTIKEQWSGVHTGQVENGRSFSLPDERVHILSDGTVHPEPIVLDAGPDSLLPLQVAPAAIIVKPIPNADPVLIGESQLTVSVSATDTVNMSEGSITLPIVANCN